MTYNHRCNYYPDSTAIDSSWKAARAFSVLTVIFAIIILVVQCIVACSIEPGPKSAAGRVTPLYVVTGVCQGLVLLFLASNACKNNPLAAWESITFPDTCSLSTGARCCISATVFWFAAALSSFQEQKAWEKERNEFEPVSLTEPLAP